MAKSIVQMGGGGETDLLTSLSMRMVLLLSLITEEDCWSYAHVSVSSRSLYIKHSHH